MLAAGQIYFLRKVVVVGEASYGRPCLVLRTSKHDATICYFSTKMEYREPGEVEILATDPDFKASGLRASSWSTIPIWNRMTFPRRCPMPPPFRATMKSSLSRHETAH
jgi:hypothetical protein